MMSFDFWEMEEHVGRLWDRLITRASCTRYPDAAVTLKTMQKTLNIVFRAMGGDGGLNIQSASATEHHARRTVLQRVAGTQHTVELGWLDDQSLRLPDVIDVFPDAALNRKLYIWLTALASQDDGQRGPWFARNQQLTVQALHRYPGLKADYQQLIDAQLRLRPDIKKLPADEAAQEQAIQHALRQPGQQQQFPIAKRPPQPVVVWLHPSPPVNEASGFSDTNDAEASANADAESREDERKRKAKRENNKDSKGGLLSIRFENIFSWSEFSNLDRSQDEEKDLDAAAGAMQDMDTVSLAKNRQSLSSRLKVDLDLPSDAHDDIKLGEGILLPEWHYKQQRMQDNHVCLQHMIAREAMPCELPAHLRKTALRLRHQLEMLKPSRIWHKAQQDGSELDLEAFLHFTTQRKTHHGDTEGRLYKALKNSHRDLACLLLADLSLSTDAWVNNSARVIDVIRDSLFLFAECLNATGDRFAIHGFSSRSRNHVRFNLLKNFEDTYNTSVRGLIQAVKPGYYTRMGAAIRHASDILSKQPSQQKLLLILTDGKPNDIDVYEGRYGVEDTRMAVHEARQMGLQPFCVTIDEKAGSYLPHLFGSGNYVVIRKAEELPKELPLLYARLTNY
jgi:nitric oxide reductase NorD protein